MVFKTDVAKYVYERKYRKEGETSWADTVLRVVNHVSQVEKEEQRNHWMQKFFQIIYDRYFIPGGRILANAGTTIENLMNCFYLDIEDSRQGIYSTLKDAAEIFAHGGGLGYNFSQLREKGAHIKGTGGKASGPVSFMELFDTTGEVIEQASRRGAQMAILNVDHPDIVEFINMKSILSDKSKKFIETVEKLFKKREDKLLEEEVKKTIAEVLRDTQMTHFNISVGVLDDFMRAVKNDDVWELKSVLTGKPIKKVKARGLLKLMAARAWESGDPGVIFLDRVNKDNIVPYYGELRGSNPCGEIFLFDKEACNLGAINLSKFYEEESNSINFPLLEEVVRIAVRFLDDVISVSKTPLEDINKVVRSLRRMGLGVMGWADLLAQLEIPYNSEQAYELAEYISWFITMIAIDESYKLGEEKGAFPLYNPDKVNFAFIEKVMNKDGIKYNVKRPLRNVSWTAIQPTGSIALIAEVNSAIEPFFALAYKRNISLGENDVIKTVIIMNELLEEKLRKYGLTEEQIEEVKKYVLENGTLKNAPYVPEKLQKVFITSKELTPEEHIKMQAAWQKYISNSVSKTINMPNEATIEDVEKAFILMWEMGLKGGTIYRDKSKITQVLM